MRPEILKLERKKIISLSLFPIALIFLLSPLQNYRGPRYRTSDPEYAYLMNSLSILNFNSPQHRDHPGTTVQTLGGVTLKLMHPFLPRKNIIEKVVESPEWYLNVLSFSLTLVSTFIVFMCGILVAQATRSLGSALLFQAFPFLSQSTWLHWGKFSPDMLALALGMLMGALVFYRNKKNAGLFTGITYGALLATKLTGIPLVLIGVFSFSKNKRELLKFTGSAVLSFCFFILPIFHKWGLWHLWNWGKNLFFSKKAYGEGEAGFIGFNRILDGANTLLHHHPAIAMTMASILTFFIYWARYKTAKKKTKSPYDLENVLPVFSMIGLILVLVLFLFAKAPSPHYLFPVLGLTGLFFSIFIQAFQKQLQQLAVVIPSLVLFIALTQALLFATDIGSINGVKNDMSLLEKKAKEHGCTIIPSYPASSIPNALRFGNDFTGKKFLSFLENQYPSSVFFEFDTGFFDFERRVIAPGLLKKLGKKLCLRGNFLDEKLSSEKYKGTRIPFSGLKPLLKTSYDNELYEILW